MIVMSPNIRFDVVGDAAEKIKNAETIESLAAILNAVWAALDEDERIALGDLVDFTSLKSFGGPTPDDTHGVYSWDWGRVLVYVPATDKPWRLEPRNDT